MNAQWLTRMTQGALLAAALTAVPGCGSSEVRVKLAPLAPELESSQRQHYEWTMDTLQERREYLWDGAGE